MTTAEHLDTIDRLREQGFPEVRGRSEAGISGPGYHLAELGASRWYGDEDAADRIAQEDQISAEFGALTLRLEERWGAADTFSLDGLRLRAGSGEVASPWREIGDTCDHLNLWRAGDRWVAVYAARWGADHSPQLMAAVTVIDPP
ncbi:MULTISPECIES: hypothetical protein [unclassified Streptomyces]|uniref:hypothetical protein n=1 Tax=unclassified Streptomyces TaxID=2593676 RepID=UPI001BE94D49|nr:MULTISPECIES: hypothetical protein [unclassified Streptomyces]MBT2403308.1 hypothetical protein [Streptomyces sp. ISL-21]MBT2459602.1 hypothetical protein [Streptomyces sp. ISL-86]MBT2609736.1 hypothetical protein [Streptomyces sp. ISL-87]